MKTKLYIILLSIALCIVPAFLIGLGFYLAGGSFLKYLFLSFGLIWVLGLSFDTFLQHKTQVDIEKINLKLKELELQQSVEVSCAYCKERCIVPVTLNSRNTFDCKNCNQTNLLIFQFATAMVTTPLETNLLGAINNDAN